MTRDGLAAAPLTILLCASAGAAHAHEPPPPFSCGPGAVSIDIDRHPGHRLARLPAAPNLPSGMAPSLTLRPGQGPFASIEIYVVLKAPEDGWGRGTAAPFALYARARRWAATSPEFWRLDAPDHPKESWMDPDRLAYSRRDSSGEHPGRDVTVVPATPDARIPIVDVGFTIDLGGANADNWDDHHLLIDLRGILPHLAAALSCGFNQGGGACTAIDSGQMARSGAQCAWVPARSDFLCSERMDDGYAHRDSYLLGGGSPPLRRGEVRSVADGASLLRGSPDRRSVVVRGVGPVSLVRDVALATGRHLAVLGGGGGFYVLDAGASPVAVDPRPLVASPSDAVPTGVVSASDTPWTREAGPVFSSAIVQRTPSLTVLQVVAREPSGDHTLYWLGLEDHPGAPTADALVLAREGQSYMQCGRWRVAASVIEVTRTVAPFRATVRVQPTGSTDWDQGLVWGTESHTTATDCARDGEIAWKKGRGFTVRIDDRPCAAPGKPRWLRIDDQGRITLVDTPPAMGW